ncbi:MAG: DUF1385 domain-containing protein [Ruminococcaceae bacterium]|nr:DUF1385 domain-containing protein [Oscillospiraceae bacterium]
MSKKEKCKCARKSSIGGQALMEGIMMRGPQKSAMAVRRPNGQIFFEEKENVKKQRPRICRWPIIRGVFGFVDSMVMGYKCLMRSAEIAMEETGEGTEAEAVAEGASTLIEQSETKALDDVSPTPKAATEETDSATPAADALVEQKPENEKKKDAAQEPQSMIGKGTMAAITIIATVLGVALAVGLFIWLPSFLYEKVLVEYVPGWPKDSFWLRSVCEGVLKIAVLVLYMAAVSLMKDIRRTFMYHGAEHKTIFCYEQGLPLTVDNVKKQRRFHPRCGTSFLILMLIVSILIGFLIPSAQVLGLKQTVVYTLVRAAIKLLLIPLTMGIGYELLKLAGRYDNIFTRIISAPGMWLQRITVREPTDDMIECAIKAFVAVLPEEEKAKALTEETPVAEEKTDAE